MRVNLVASSSLILFPVSFIVVFVSTFLLLVVYASWYYGALEAAAGFTVLHLLKRHFFLGSDPHSCKKCVQDQDCRELKFGVPMFDEMTDFDDCQVRFAKLELNLYVLVAKYNEFQETNGKRAQWARKP